MTARLTLALRLKASSAIVVVSITLGALAGCAGSSGSDAPAPLSGENINLVFVLSPDLTYSAAGDVNPGTANLTNQGLNRSLKMATYLKQQVLGGSNASGIYAISPMTHLQTANNLPDMAAIGAIQQFAMLNQFTQPLFGSATTATSANSFPLNVSYAAGMVLPTGVVAPFLGCLTCQGLDFSNSGGANDALLSGLVNAKASGFHVFSAPWATTSAMLTNLNKLYGASLTLPSTYSGPNQVYAVSITPAGSATLTTFDANLNPSVSAPVLPVALPQTACTAQPSKFSFTLTAGQPYSQTVDGITSTGSVPAVLPQGISTNQTVYMIRHAEAHPSSSFENGNFVAPGQWRALGLADALRGKINPDLVVSIDPAQVIPSGGSLASPYRYSYVRTTMTVAPYAIANNLPFYLVSSFSLMDINFTDLLSSASVVNANDYFFTGGRFSGKKVLLAWEHDHFPLTLNELLKRYFPNGGQPAIVNNFWPDADYDTVWTVTLDAQGNLTAGNGLCEGIDSNQLPNTAPAF
jgi:hypothetical protein